MDTSKHDLVRQGVQLIKGWPALKHEAVEWLKSPELYIQLLLIGLSVALAWLLGMLITRRIRGYIVMHPPRHMEPETFLRPLQLIAPIITLIYLIIAQPISEEYSAIVGNWVDPSIQICIAFIVSQTVVMLVRTRPIAYFLAFLILSIAVLEALGFTRPVAELLKSYALHVGQYKLSLYNLLQGMVILVIVFWLAGVLSRSLENYLRRASSLSYSARELIVKFFRIFVYFIALIITLSAIGVDLTAFAVFGGALGVGLGLGLQKVTANFVSGITLLLEKSIQIGDLLEIGGLSGWVRQLNVRYTLLETADGREVLIPNEELVSTRVINWTHTNNMARIDITVGVAYGTDPQLVIKLMQEAASEHPRTLKREKPPACFLREFGASSLNFLLVFWVPDVQEGRYGTQSEVMMSILAKFKAAGIDIPYPHMDIQIKRH